MIGTGRCGRGTVRPQVLALTFAFTLKCHTYRTTAECPSIALPTECRGLAHAVGVIGAHAGAGVWLEARRIGYVPRSAAIVCVAVVSPPSGASPRATASANSSYSVASASAAARARSSLISFASCRKCCARSRSCLASTAHPISRWGCATLKPAPASGFIKSAGQPAWGALPCDPADFADTVRTFFGEISSRSGCPSNVAAISAS